jgi:anti-sigma B factor antagonist
VGAGPAFRIEERREAFLTRISVTGELDMATGPALAERFRDVSLAIRRKPRGQRTVRVDLSKVEFIDSTGVHVLYEALHHATSDGWRLQIERELRPQVRDVARITGLDRFFTASEAS